MGVYRRKRRDGTYLYEFRQTIRGVKYYESIPEARTKLQADVAAAQILKSIYEGKYGKEGGEIGAYDFAKFVDDVYLPHAKGHVRQYHQTAYKCGILKDAFRGKRLRDITLLEVEKFRRHRLAGTLPVRASAEDRRRRRCLRPARPVTVKTDIRQLSTVLNFAIDNDYAAANPCRRIKWKRGEVVEARSRTATPDEIEALLKELEGDRETRAAVLLALNCGLRRAGVLSLGVSDVDFEARVLRYSSKGGGRKVVPVNRAALEVLRELAAGAQPSGRLFSDAYGYSLSYNRGAFKQACKRAGVVGLNFHDLRRTFSERVDKLAGATTARDLLGHSTVQTTGTHYLPENFEAMRRAVEALDSSPNVVSFQRRKRG